MSSRKTCHLPSLARFILKRMSLYNERHSIIENFEETYQEIRKKEGILKANIWCWMSVIQSLFGYIGLSVLWRFVMIKNYLKTAFRILKKHKGHSVINILGLTVGMAAFILISLYVQYELSYDDFHENTDRLYRIINNFPSSYYQGNSYGFSTPPPLSATLMDEFSEVEYAVKLTQRRILFNHENRSNFEIGLFTDKHFFDVFSFKLLRGDKNIVLADPYSVVINEKLARKYFGSENPIGKIMKVHTGGVNYDLRVTGIIDETPDNSHIRFDFLIPFETQFPVEKRARQLNNWMNWSHRTYVLLKDRTLKKTFEPKLSLIINKYYPERYSAEGSKKLHLLIQPIKNIHLGSDINLKEIIYIYVFSFTAFFILLIACMNYMNLTTSYALKRAREIGIRKVSGAQRKQLFWQFMGETLLISIISLVIAIGLVCLFLPSFNTFIERNIDIGIIRNRMLCTGVFAAIITGFLSGIYPSLFLSSFSPNEIFSGTSRSSIKRNKLRAVFVILQFCITSVLITSSLAIFKQIDYIKNIDVGYNRDQIVVIPIQDNSIRKNIAAFKNELLNNRNVVDLTLSSQYPAYVSNGAGWKGKDEAGGDIEFHYNVLYTDYNFIDVYKLELAEGRNFKEKITTDSSISIIINQEFAKAAGWKNPLGKNMPDWLGKNAKVIGVIKNFNFRSLHSSIKPLIMVYDQSRMTNYVSIRINSENIPGILSHFERTYKEFNPQYPFTYYFLDDVFNSMYRKETKMGWLAISFSIVSILIACIGMFGLALFNVERRTKEVGIRKVLGASVLNIVLQLVKEFIIWVIIAYAFAVPIAYYSMSKWLQNFAYKMNTSIWMLIILSAGIALFIALLSVSYQTIKAATANPVDSLRYE